MRRTTRSVLGWAAGLALLVAASAVPAAAQMSRSPESEVGKLPITYAWAVDAKDIDAMMSIFSEDVVYDLSAYGYPSVVGQAAVRNFFLYAVFPSEQCSFSSISNVTFELEGNQGTGADYFVHWGYNNPRYPANTRYYAEGQHFYEFKRENGEWKISSMRGRPTFEKTEPFDPAGMKHCP